VEAKTLWSSVNGSFFREIFLCSADKRYSRNLGDSSQNKSRQVSGDAVLGKDLCYSGDGSEKDPAGQVLETSFRILESIAVDWRLQ
jgi:hypothetical protein